MPHPLEQLREEALREIESATDEQALETYASKISRTQRQHFRVGGANESAPKEEKPVVGKLLNEVRNAVTAAVETRNAQFRLQKESGALARIDISLPGTPHGIGSLHPLHQMHERAIQIFRRMGFALAEGPDVEDGMALLRCSEYATGPPCPQ